MGATVGPNVAISNFIAKDIIRRVADEASVGHDCKSTEELLCKFEEYNEMRIQKNYNSKNIIVASMDIDKWFPSIKTRQVAKEIKQMVIDSGIEFKDINYDKVSEYLGKYMTVADILVNGFEELLYINDEKMEETSWG
jgi:hypothetical protein